MSDWFAELVDEYPTKSRSDAAKARLLRVYADVPDTVMVTAVYAYMRHGSYFPKVADLRSFVEAALEAERGNRGADSVIHKARLTTGQELDIYHTDDEILAWEQARGTMPQAVTV